MKHRAIYIDPGVAELETFFDSVIEEAGENAALDSIRSINESRLREGKLPERLQAVLSVMPEKDQHRVLDSVAVGMRVYESEHGVKPTADVIAAALQQGLSAAFDLDGSGRPVDKSGKVLDSVGSTSHHDQISAQPNRIVVAITSAIAEAIPFATYLPTDIGSNEARLGIVTHLAGSDFGGYTQNEIMDGVNIGKAYLSAERRITLALDVDRDDATGQFTTTVGGGTGMKVLRGRTIILVNGIPCAAESPNTAPTVANSPISGTATIGSTDYTISGTVTIATGAVAVSFSPALPENTVVEAEGFIDYEANTALTPVIMTQVATFALFATPWRALCDQTVDSKTQYSNELGLDLQSENLMAVRNQFAMERHYAALYKAMRLAANNAHTYDFDWDGQKTDKTRARIWQDAMAVIGQADQQMAEQTMDHGISHMYVGKLGMAQMLTLPRDIFEPSGIVARPGIYRIGRLFNRYDVYYTPKLINEDMDSGASQILCVGRSPQVARCPIVLGDAVAPTYLPLAMGRDMKYQNGFYARNFTSVNPHVPSARGAALINITNLF